MITEDGLRETLRWHERLAPDAAPVAARIAAGVRTRRRHRAAGAIAAVAAAATVAAVAVPALALRAPAGHRAAGAGSAVTGPAASGAAASGATAPAVRFDPLAIPFTVGWLPAGWHPRGTLDSKPGIALRMYDGLRGADELAVQLWDTRLSGKSAADPPAAGAVVRRHVHGDVWLAVAGTLPAAELDRVLWSVDLRRSEQLTFPFRLTWVPAGYRPTDSDSGAHHWYGDAAGNTLRADPPLLGAGLGLDSQRTPAAGGALEVGVSTEDGSTAAKGSPANSTFLGRPSRYEDSDGLAVLQVYGLRGMHVSVSAVRTGHPELTRAALERVMRGVRLVDDPSRLADWTDRPLG